MSSVVKSGRARLLARRVKKAQKRAATVAAPVLKNLSVYSIYDRINAAISKINELEQENDPKLAYDRLIKRRSLEREILVLAEHAIKIAPPEMRAHFCDRRDSALQGVAFCNERLA